MRLGSATSQTWREGARLLSSGGRGIKCPPLRMQTWRSPQFLHALWTIAQRLHHFLMTRLFIPASDGTLLRRPRFVPSPRRVTRTKAIAAFDFHRLRFESKVRHIPRHYLYLRTDARKQTRTMTGPAPARPTHSVATSTRRLDAVNGRSRRAASHAGAGRGKVYFGPKSNSKSETLRAAEISAITSTTGRLC